VVLTLKDDLKEIAQNKSSVDEAFITLKDMLWTQATFGMFSAEYQSSGLREQLRCDEETYDELLDIMRLEEIYISQNGNTIVFHWR